MTKGRASSSLKIGDVCLVRDDNQPRLQWPLVRLLDAHVGRDGDARTYSVRFANGTTRRRAAQLIYPLEVTTPLVQTPGGQELVDCPTLLPCVDLKNAAAFRAGVSKIHFEVFNTLDL